MIVELREDNFSKIISINEQVKNLTLMSASIRLQALNALILSLKSGNEAAAFEVVAKEVIHFSKKVDILCGSNLILVKELVRNSSNQILFLKKNKVWQRTQRINNHKMLGDFIKNKIEILNKKEKSEIEQSNLILKELFIDLKQSEKIFLEGKMISIQTKIEGAHMSHLSSLFEDIAVKFENVIEKMQDYVIKIQVLIKEVRNENNSRDLH